ncbi:hypothetical protein ACFE04_019838 [Oxalis oulophora]
MRQLATKALSPNRNSNTIKSLLPTRLKQRLENTAQGLNEKNCLYTPAPICQPGNELRQPSVLLLSTYGFDDVIEESQKMKPDISQLLSNASPPQEYTYVPAKDIARISCGNSRVPNSDISFPAANCSV